MVFHAMYRFGTTLAKSVDGYSLCVGETPMRSLISGLLSILLVISFLSAMADQLDLLPNRAWLTVQKSPVLYYWISHATSLPIRFTLVDQRKIRPLVEVELESPTRSGFWAIRLKDYNIVLDEEVQYSWFVSVTRNSDLHEEDIVAGGVIERVDPRLVDYYGYTCDRDSVLRAEKAGLWYDAFACVNRLIEANPENRSLRHLRQRLLKQQPAIPHAIDDPS